MLVAKFGGTSLGGPAAIQRVTGIIRDRQQEALAVVVSAVAKTTDELVSFGGAASQRDREKVGGLREWIIQKHLAIQAGLGLAQDPELSAAIHSVGEELGRISATALQRGEVSLELMDDCLSWGEFLSCHILVAYLRKEGIRADWVDSRKIIRTNDRFGRARPHFQPSRVLAESEIGPLLAEGRVAVMQGFVGADVEGRTTTFGRGGSDYSATVLAALLGARRVEIWTDVDGIMTADPSLVEGVHRIKSMTFAEAAELAYFGAKVLHPSTLLPAVERGIPVRVLNSTRPSEPGTEIYPEASASGREVPVVKSIAYKEGLSVLSIRSTRMLMAYGFLATIFEVFNRYETPVDLVSTSEVSVSVTVDSLDRIDQIVESLSEIAEVDIRHQQAIVCLVGQGICREPGLPARVFGELEGIQINLISQGASDLAISFVIDESDLPRVTNRLHQRFFSDVLDERIFA